LSKEGVVEERNRALKILENFGFLTAGRVIGDAFVFLLFVILSRFFGQEGIGQYSFAIGLTGFFAVFADFGLFQLTVKEAARLSGLLGTFYGQILSLRLFLSSISYVVLLLIIPFLPFSRESKLIIAIIGAYQLMSQLVDGLIAIFLAREDTHLAGLIEFSHKAAVAVVAIAVVIAGGSLMMSLAVLPVISVGQLVVAYLIVAKKYGRPRLMASLSSLKHLLREAMPYALSEWLSQVYSRVAIVFLGFTLGVVASGVYNVAYRVVFLLKFIPFFAAMAVFPLASRLYTYSRKEFESLYHKSMSSIILLGLPIAFGIWLIAPNLITLVFGETFHDSISVLRILTWMLLFGFLTSLMGVFLMSCDRQVERTKIQWKVALLNVVGNLVLIPSFGVKGAAVTALTSEILLATLFAVRLKKVIGWPRIGSRLIMGGIAVASFCLPFIFLRSLHIGVVIPMSALLYFLTLALFKKIRRNEVRLLLSLLKRESKRLVA
jgi:O-antigen/teichoic acid export membrane protein